jgi:predicted dehydrogenase
MSSSDKIRVGVIGAGTNTKLRHIPGLLAIDGVSVDVVCNRSEQSSKQAASAFGIRRIAADWKSIVADDSIDAICIGTWPYLHAEISIAALNAGKHVLTEARMAMNAIEAQAMLDASRANPSLVAQVVASPFSLKWDTTIAEILRSGLIGDLREIRSIKTLPMNVDSNSPLNWRQNIEYSGNNAMMLGIYYEPVQRWLREEPTRVWASGRIFTETRLNPETGDSHRVRIPETLDYVAEYVGGLRFSGHMTGLELGSGRDEYAICGSRGTLRLDLQAGELYQTLLGEEEVHLEPKPEAVGAWNVEADFIDSIRSGKPVTLTSFEDGLNYMRFTDAVKASFESGGAWQELG